MRKLLSILFFMFMLAANGQVNQAYVQYVEQWSATAIDQMQRYRIPASITLAQGLLESGAGTSRLARQSNNHFGIKVGVGWKGPYVVFDDDAPNERFRKYKTVAESYEDHSKFLQQPRYRQLFNLSITDYKGWARGLKACGYATNPKYADLLISIIERYDLTQYDRGKGGKWRAPSAGKQSGKAAKHGQTPTRTVGKVNGIPCVKAQSGDTWQRISQQTGVKVSRLLKYNEVDVNYPITPGTNIFLAKKARKGERIYKRFWHKIKRGESMHDISQQYGIRVKYLFKMNFRDPSYVPAEGDLLKVR